MPAREEKLAAQASPIFEATDRWGEKIVLTVEDWARITAKRPDVAGHENDVLRTIESPSIVYEGRYANSKAFYKKGLLANDPLHWDCYVATIIRYPQDGDPPSIRTVYFPSHIQGAALGTLLFMER